MPERRPPGVHIGETPSGPRPMPPVGTTVAGFVGPAPAGPVEVTPGRATSLAEFERVYGDSQPLVWGGAPRTNHLWHAARAFFAEGGRELRVARVCRPAVDEYARALGALETVEDIAIVAAPGASDPFDDVARAVQELLLAHAERMRYRFAVLDSGPGMRLAEIRQQRSLVDSAHGALYYPWVRVADPRTGAPVDLPPSGFVAGIYARVDIARGVWHAPADAAVTLATGLERPLAAGQQEALKPEGIYCIRFVPGRGYRVWGARTVSADPDWTYVNVRRYLSYLERSIDRGTQWVVFEPNGEPLWAGVRQSVEEFLVSEWRKGALAGDRPDRAFFVACDRTTMTQDDLERGRLVCQVGVAPVRPAEFVIFRIGQWTGDAKQ